MFTISEVLKHIKTNEPFGYVITAGGSYSVGVSKDKAIELGVQDVEIAHLMDFNERVIVPIGKTKYAIPERNNGFFEELSDCARDYFGDRVVYYGYYFEPQNIIELDSDVAIQRMIAEVKGVYHDE